MKTAALQLLAQVCWEKEPVLVCAAAMSALRSAVSSSDHRLKAAACIAVAVLAPALSQGQYFRISLLTHFRLNV